MRRAWKVLIGVVIVLAVLLAANTIALNNETKPAEATVDGGEILELSGGDVQVLEDGPASGGSGDPRSCSCTATRARSTGGIGSSRCSPRSIA